MSAHVLGKVPLFATLPPAELEQLAAELRPCARLAGTVLFNEGECGDHFYVVVEGRIEIIKALGTREERLLSTRGPGEFVGEMSLLNRDGRRTATVRVVEDAELLEMRRADFDGLLHRYPLLAYEMTRLLSDRLTAWENNVIAELREKNRELQTSYDALKAAQAQVIEKEKLERELQLARAIQMGLLPAALPAVPGYGLGAHLLPARAVGGDLFAFVPLGADRLGVVVGDAADKGMPAAIFMAQSLALLRAEASTGALPAEVLRRVNRHLLPLNQAEQFVTAFYGVLDLPSGALRYARAGHEVPLLVDPAVGGAARLPRTTGQPLAIFDEPVLDEGVVALPHGGTLLIFSDGVPDAREPGGDLFGSSRLARAAAAEAAVSGSAQAFCSRLLELVISFQGGAPQHDDITLVAIRRGE
jgi:sigma-B regulation protein RsbU (phosphoserine phosphatase)